MKHALYTLSLDLGQAQDYSALSLLEQQVFIGPDARNAYHYPLEPGWQSPQGMDEYLLDICFSREGGRQLDHHDGRPPLHVRQLYRFPLGTPYPAVVEETARLLAQFDHTPFSVQFVIDATGVGRPVFDLFRQRGLNPHGILIHGGDTHTHSKGLWRVPKRDLVTVVQSRLQQSQLIVAARLPEAGVLREELRNFKVKIDPKTAHDSYSAWRDGDHDDLVLSVAMGCWIRDRLWTNQDAQRMRVMA